MGISVQASGIGVQTDKYYLINLNADPSMSELLVCYLKEYTRIGRPDTAVPQVKPSLLIKPHLFDTPTLGYSVTRFRYS